MGCVLLGHLYPIPLAGRVARCIGPPFSRRAACRSKPRLHPCPSPWKGGDLLSGRVPTSPSLASRRPRICRHPSAIFTAETYSYLVAISGMVVAARRAGA